MEELEAISPLLAGMERRLPFAAPPVRYFDELPALILKRIETGASEELVETGLEEMKGLSGVLSLEISPLEELQELSEVETSPSEELRALSVVLAKMDKKLPFSVPEGYFDALSAGILENIRSGLTDTEKETDIFLPGSFGEKNPASIQKKNPYAVPENYFQEFSGKLMDRIKRSADAATPAIQQGTHFDSVGEIAVGATKQGPHSASGQLQSAAKEQSLPTENVQGSPAKVVSLRAKQKWVRYAAAALVAGIIAGAGWIFLGSQDDHTGRKSQSTVTVSGNDPRTLSNISPEDIGNLSVAEIGDYLETESPFLPDEAALAFAELSLSDLQGMLADIPDEALQRYLIQTGNAEERIN